MTELVGGVFTVDLQQGGEEECCWVEVDTGGDMPTLDEPVRELRVSGTSIRVLHAHRWAGRPHFTD